MNRIEWEEYFIEITKLVAQRSSCLSRQVGAILVKEKRILATGYNGSPSKIENCIEKGGCLRKGSKSGENLNTCMAVHAEMNAILQMARYGVSCEDTVLYVTTFPCINCMKAIINSGIREIVYLEDYDAPLSKQLAELSGIKIRKYEKRN